MWEHDKWISKKCSTLGQEQFKKAVIILYDEEFWLELAYLVPVVSVCTNTNILNYCLNGHGYCELMAKSLVFPSCGMGAPIGSHKWGELHLS